MTYKVVVKVLAEVEYEVTIEAASEYKAEMKAEAMWRENLPSDFQVEKGYLTEIYTEAERLTWECGECGDQITEEQNNKHDEMCVFCYADATADRARGAA